MRMTNESQQAADVEVFLMAAAERLAKRLGIRATGDDALRQLQPWAPVLAAMVAAHGALAAAAEGGLTIYGNSRPGLGNK